MQSQRRQRRASGWAFAPETVGGQTNGGLDHALSILNQKDPSEYAQPTGLVLESAGDLQRLWEMRNELRRLVEEWQACGQSFAKMFRKDRERGVAFQTGWAASFGPDGRFHIQRDGLSLDTTPHGVALTVFAMLMNNTDRLLLGGPCDRCGRYFRKNRTNHKTYCGRDCAHLASATKSTKERLQREREEKLRQAKLRIAQWQALKRKPKVGWKKWIVAAVPGLSLTFLTRAVNSGDLVAPVDGANTLDS